jgi:hypothetical protein
MAPASHTALPCAVPACLEGGGIGISALSTPPIRTLRISPHFLKRSGRAFPVIVFQYPEFRPGINRGESSNGPRGVLISHQALDVLPLQFTACLGYCDQSGVGVDKPHLSLGAGGKSFLCFADSGVFYLANISPTITPSKNPPKQPHSKLCIAACLKDSKVPP